MLQAGKPLWYFYYILRFLQMQVKILVKTTEVIHDYLVKCTKTNRHICNKRELCSDIQNQAAGRGCPTPETAKRNSGEFGALRRLILLF